MPAQAQKHIPETSELVDLPIDQLSDIVVTTVARREQTLAEAPASIYVITRDQIRRSGATTLAEALRLAPNLQVARADANQYAISARGFNSVLANKLLVRIDGRTVYSPLFSGVFWEAQDVLLEDVDRIEVVSGPGGVQWGSNAVNGLINVITRSARETHGVIAGGGLGTEVGLGEARYGTSSGAMHVRASGKFLDQESTENAAGDETGDASQHWLASIRGEWIDSVQSVLVRAGTFYTEIDQAVDERLVREHNVFARWRRSLGPDQQLWVWGIYTRGEREQPGAINEELDTYEADFQHQVRLGYQHDVLWGAGYRYQQDDVENLVPNFAFDPANQDVRYTHLFALDEIRVNHTTDLILGARLEHNIYTQWEFLPSVRFAWRPRATGHLVWGAVSRAVRAPSRIDREFFSPASPPHFLLAGGPDFDSEIANVAEIGFRSQPSPLASYSITLYLQDYDRLRTIEPSAEGPVFANLAEGTVHGLEAWASWRARPWWRIDGGGVWLHKDIRYDAESLDPTDGAQLGNDPDYWFRLHSGIDIRQRHEFDVFLRHSGSLPAPEVPSYTAVDARVGTQLTRLLDFAVTGYNLLDERHAEWGVAPGRPEFERSVYVELRLRAWHTD